MAVKLSTSWVYALLRSALVKPVNPPAWLRIFLALMAVANYRSTPLLWHARIFYPALKAAYTARAWLRPASPALGTSAAIRPQLKTSHLPIGRDIFNDTSTYHFTATLDECDWNGHLSNSSYSRSLDFTRMSHNSPRFLKMYYDGGWVALGGSAFNFHREVPMLARYEVRMSVEAWDDKWLYVVGRFASPSQSGKETLYCTSVSRYVCKAGRRTIPPWLLLATCGYGPVSNWTRAESLRESYLDQQRKAHIAKSGSSRIPAKMAKKLTRRAALLRQYRLESERTGSADEEWMSKSYWATEQWEAQRKQGLVTLADTVGILPVVEK